MKPRQPFLRHCPRVSFLYGLLLACTLPSAVCAQAIYTDTFTGGSFHTTIAGTSPDVDTPGNTWTVSNDFSSGGNFYAWTDTPGFTNGVNDVNSVFLWNGAKGSSGSGAATLSLAGSGSYTKPSQIALSADLQTVSLPSDVEGMLLGYYSALPTGSDALTGFNGFLVNNTGALMLVQNGVIGSAVAFTGTFNNELFNTLSFDINTATGAISNVSFGGNTNYNFSSTLFTDANTAYAGIGVYSTGSNAFGYADNFTVSGVVTTPEPASWALLAGGLATLLVIRRSRKEA